MPQSVSMVYFVSYSPDTSLVHRKIELIISAVSVYICITSISITFRLSDFDPKSPGWCGFDCICIIFKYAVVITFVRISSVISLMWIWIAKAPTDDKSSLVQATSWGRGRPSLCRQTLWLSHNEITHMVYNGIITKPLPERLLTKARGVTWRH